MNQDEVISFSVSPLLILLLVDNSIAAQGDEPFVQADVYNALYEAYVQCDDHFGRSRSEFITEKLQLGRGRITVASLKKILSSRVEAANQSIAKKSTERELLEQEVIRDYRELERQLEDHGETYEGPQEKLREIDALLEQQRRYVEVTECVLDVL